MKDEGFKVEVQANPAEHEIEKATWEKGRSAVIIGRDPNKRIVGEFKNSDPRFRLCKASRPFPRRGGAPPALRATLRGLRVHVLRALYGLWSVLGGVYGPSPNWFSN
jgi:hypothetical protein